MKALVAVELDVAAAPPAEARRVLGEDPGTAARVTAALCGDHRVLPLGVVTVTGRGMWADAVGAERYCDAINIGSAAPDRWVTTEGCDIAGAVRIVGRGPGWTPARWLRAATDALGPGGAQVMVATRGLVGEGWDHPPVNVLVDLSEGTSPAAATQLRGRALRINPVEPDKIASLWDVAVVHGAAPGDWERLRRRHQHWWGPDGAGRIVTGPAKLHPRLGRPAVPEPHELDLLNEASAAAVADLDRMRAAWAAVEPGGAGASVVHVRRSRLRRQVSTRATVEKRRHRVRAGGGVAVGGLAGGVGGALFYRPLAGLIVIGALAGTGLAASTKVPGRDAELRRLRALGRGVLAGLGAIGAGQASTAQVEVDVDADGTLSVRIDGAGDQLATVWADAVSEMLGPLGTPRWIVVAAGEAWRVPAVVGPTRDAAEAFRSAFARHVRGAVLVRAGTPEATALVLADAGRRTEPVDRSRRWGR